MSITPSIVQENLEKVVKRIESVGNSLDELQIVAVTKYQPDEAITSAYEIGIRNFGENYLDGIKRRQKFEELTDIKWHFIGTIQRNKFNSIINESDVIQSIDREQLIAPLMAAKTTPDLFIQVNLVGEEGRGGASWEEASKLVEAIREAGLSPRGLMGVGPVDASESRPYFRRLAQMARDLELFELSIGMSDDLEVAVEEGATMVRLGSALFGSRPHSLQ